MTQEYKIGDFIDRETLEKMADNLTAFALGEIELTTEQVEATMMFVNKAVPSLKPISLEEALADEPCKQEQ